jgi:hypothetical protein
MAPSAAYAGLRKRRASARRRLEVGARVADTRASATPRRAAPLASSGQTSVAPNTMAVGRTASSAAATSRTVSNGAYAATSTGNDAARRSADGELKV